MPSSGRTAWARLTARSEATVALDGHNLDMQALRWKPVGEIIYYNMGNALWSAGRSDEAVSCYRRALEIKPDFAEAGNNLDVCLKSLKNTAAK